MTNYWGFRCSAWFPGLYARTHSFVRLADLWFLLNVKQPALPERQPENLMVFAGNPRKDMPEGLPFALNAPPTGRLLYVLALYLAPN